MIRRNTNPSWKPASAPKRGGAAYDTVTAGIRKKQIAKGRIKFVDATPALMTRYEQDSAAVHKWWINKTKNGQKVFDLYQKTLVEIRK